MFYLCVRVYTFLNPATLSMVQLIECTDTLAKVNEAVRLGYIIGFAHWTSLSSPEVASARSLSTSSSLDSSTLLSFCVSPCTTFTQESRAKQYFKYVYQILGTIPHLLAFLMLPFRQLLWDLRCYRRP